MEKLHSIIRKNGMSTRPEYFSGRGATLSDLNSEILFSIHKDIKNGYGKDAADNFVKMVADIKVASATTFLNELYRLFGNNWKHTSNEHQDKKGVHVPKDENGEYDDRSLISGMMGVTNAMNQKFDSTPSIVGPFLRANGIKPKSVVINEWGDRASHY